jgi:hypothetical protein
MLFLIFSKIKRKKTPFAFQLSMWRSSAQFMLIEKCFLELFQIYMLQMTGFNYQLETRLDFLALECVCVALTKRSCS